MRHHWIVALDTARKRSTLDSSVLVRAVGEALAAAANGDDLVLLDHCVLSQGVRALLAASSIAVVRRFARRFNGLFAARAPAGSVTWSAVAGIRRILPGSVDAYQRYLGRCRAAFEVSMQMTTPTNRSARAALGAIKLLERSNAQLLGTQEYDRRVRRYLGDHDAPADDTIAFRRLCTVIFAQGLGFEAVERHRSALDEAFFDFIPARVAELAGRDIEPLLRAPIIRNRLKIAACLENARRWVSLRRDGQSYLSSVAEVAAHDDAESGWPRLVALLQRDFLRLRETTARLVLKSWGFFTARPHPTAQRTLERLGMLKPGGDFAAVQTLLCRIAEASGEDPYALEAAILIFAAAGPCGKEPRCTSCVLCDRCPTGLAARVDAS